MPTSKQARARQARQKERLAVLQAERAHNRRRNQRWFAAAGALVVIIGILLAVFVGPTSGSKSSSSPTTVPATTAPAPTTSPTTTAALKSVKGKPCVAMKGAPPAGAPKVPVQVGPPPTTLVIKDLKVGTGATATAKSKITADYIGVACTTGKMFGSSFGGEAFAAQLPTDVIQGWQYGIPGMKVGGERLLGIPAAMAYGSTGRAPDIAPDEPLWFVINLKNVA